MKQRLVFILCICLVAVFWNSKGSFAQTKENTEDSVKVFYPTLNYNSPKEYVIEDVKVSGVQFLSSDLIISNTGITKGDTIYLPSDYITNSINQLWAQRCFSNVKVLVETEGNKAFLEIVLQERPRVSAWYFEGIKSSDEKKLRNDQLRLRERTEVSDFALKTSKDIILKYLKEKGYRNAEVNIRQKPDTLLDNFVTITFDIDKGEKVKIEEITFEGNEQLEEKKLKLAMKKTRERGLINILKSAKLNDQDFKDDKALLSDYMQSNGFRDGVLISDSIYAINDKRIGIKLTISEGQKYYYRNINWTGNVKYPDWYLEEQLRIKEGDVYDKLLMQEQLGIGSEGAMAAFNGARNVSTIYQNDGHLNFELIPVETVISGDSIDIDIRINEGNQYTINNVTISGNSRTNDRVIRRELAVRPGELYDQSMLYYTMRQLGNMGHFNAETISPDIRPISDDLTDVIFGVEEIPSDNIELSGGWGSGMFIASVGLNLNNVSIRNFFEKGAWKPYPTGDNQQISVSIQSNGTYYQAMSLSFLEPWLGGKKPTSLSTSVFYSSQSDSYYVYDESTSRFRTLGVSAGLGKRLTWPDPNFAIFGSLSYQSYNLTDWDSFLITDGTTNTIALSATLSRTSTDQGFYPRRGSELSITGTVTPPWSYLNGKDYSDETMTDQERYKWIEYYKVSGGAKFYTPLVNNDLVLMSSAEFGYLGAYNENNPSPFEGYTVGGDGISGYSLYGIETIGLRGYEDGALTPYASYGEQASGYVKYILELRYPIALAPESSVYGAVFAEAGNAFYSWDTFNPFNLKKSLGLGLRLYLPIIGLFGIDWGYGFDSVPGSSSRSGGQFHFSLGQSF